MHSQICPFCKIEFTPKSDGQTHTFCSRNCRVKDDRARAEMNKAFRKELGLTDGGQFSRYKKIE